MTTEMIQAFLREEQKRMNEYADKHYGARNGEDFPLIADTIMKDSGIQGAILLQNLMSALQTSMLKDKLDKENRKLEMEDILGDSAFTRVFTDMFYLGYRLGRHAEAEERRVLDQIAKDSQ